MPHVINEAGEQLIDRKFPVHNKGAVMLVDYMGDDRRVLQAARISTGRHMDSGLKGEKKDRGLINYLTKNRHTSPFEQVIFVFYMKMPIFVARQLVRHRTARLNEISGRYSVMADEFYVPAAEDVRYQSDSNKQGRSDEEVPPELQAQVQRLLEAEQHALYSGYQDMLNMDISRELARINLTLSLYTEWYWQMDLHNLFHFLGLRNDPHAQKEIRDYAQVIENIVSEVCPWSYAAWREFRKDAITFSASEIETIRAAVAGNPMTKASLMAASIDVPKKERPAFLAKLGISITPMFAAATGATESTP